MAYTPTEWQTGDIITATKLNNMEQGIANAGVLQVRDNNGTLDKTWKEITDSTFSVLVKDSGQMALYMGGFSEDETYIVGYWSSGMSTPATYSTDSQDGYPVGDE